MPDRVDHPRSQADSGKYAQFSHRADILPSPEKIPKTTERMNALARTPFNPAQLRHARVAELVDAPDLGWTLKPV